MTTGELLVEYSTLVTGTALNHFLNIETGGIGSVTVIKVAPFYKVAYIPTEPEDIVYIRQKLQKLSYSPLEEVIALKYVPSKRKILVSYIEPTTIKMKVICH